MGRLEPEPKREPLQPNAKLFPVGDPAINNTLSRINGDLFNTSCKAYNILPSFNPGVQDLINRYYINTYSDTLAWNAFVEGSMFVYKLKNNYLFLQKMRTITMRTTHLNEKNNR
jgi:hypothetical protein